MTATAEARRVGQWTETERRCLRSRMRADKDLIKSVLTLCGHDDAADRIELWAERQMMRLDRLYLNTSMPACEYTRYVIGLDEFVAKTIDGLE